MNKISFIILISIFDVFIGNNMISILQMADQDKLLKIYVSNVCLMISRVAKYIAMLAPFVISSYMTYVVYFFARINDQRSEIGESTMFDGVTTSSMKQPQGSIIDLKISLRDNIPEP